MEKIKILIVDDEEDFRIFADAHIRGWGYDVRVASGGQEAIELVKNERQDIVILDHLMPGMDGISALKEIRKIVPGIPVIMFTADKDDKSLKEAAAWGVNAFIPKLSVSSDADASLRSAIDVIAHQLKER